MCPPLFDVRLGKHVLLALVVRERELCLGLGDRDAGHDLATFEGYGHRLEARRDRPARLEDRFDQVNARVATAGAGQFGADPIALLTEAMTLHALGFLGVEE